jgi:hypothetical protein
MRLENLPQIGALCILFACMALGTLVAKASKGRIPSALVISAIMLVGFWTIFPMDLAARAGLAEPVYALCAMLIITNLGTLISRKEMASQWRTVIICLMGIVSIIAITLTVSAALFGWNIAIAATPPLTGGVVATIMTVEAAKAFDPSLAVVALICFVMQGLVGYPITSVFLGREAKRLNRLYEEGKLQAAGAASYGGASLGEKKGLFAELKDPAFILLKLLIVALLAYYAETLVAQATGGAVMISRYVWCLVLGFAGTELGFIETDALSVAKSDGVLMALLLAYLFGSLNQATWQLFSAAALPALATVLIAAAGMALMAYVASKIFRKESFSMCYSVILTAFYGFPINVMLTGEATDAATEDPNARAAIRSHILPKMLVGGFTSVTIISVLVASVLINMFK